MRFLGTVSSSGAEYFGRWYPGPDRSYLEVCGPITSGSAPRRSGLAPAMHREQAHSEFDARQKFERWVRGRGLGARVAWQSERFRALTEG